MMSLKFQRESAETCIPNISILTKLVSIPHHIKIYLFTINSSKIHKLVTTCNDNLQLKRKSS